MTLEIFMNSDDIKPTSASNDVPGVGAWAWLLAVPPLLAVIGCMITWYFILRYPDQALPVEEVRVTTDDGSAHQHVVNSVTPPLR